MEKKFNIRIEGDTTVQAPAWFTVSDEDILAYLNAVGSSKESLMADFEAGRIESVLKDIAAWMMQTGREKKRFGREDFRVDIDPEQIEKIKQMFLVTESERRVAAENPAQRAANEALKIAKALESLKNQLANLQHRQEIAQVAGLQDISEAVDRVYEYADQLRAGGVTPLGQQPQEPGVPQPQAGYRGWNPDNLVRRAKPFVDDKETPIEVVEDPAEKFRFERERKSSPHEAEKT